jgi:hypothetical protein
MGVVRSEVSTRQLDGMYASESRAVLCCAVSQLQIFPILSCSHSYTTSSAQSDLLSHRFGTSPFLPSYPTKHGGAHRFAYISHTHPNVVGKLVGHAS